MTYDISNEEKIKIIAEHLNTLEINKFDLKTSLSECYSSSVDRNKDIESLNSQIKEINKQQDALSQEMSTLNTELGIV